MIKSTQEHGVGHSETLGGTWNCTPWLAKQGHWSDSNTFYDCLLI